MGAAHSWPAPCVPTAMALDAVAAAFDANAER